MSDALSIECRDGIAWLAVNRPEVRNALDSALCAELAGAFADLGADPDVRVVVLRGAGDRAFISGADINEFRKRLATPEDALAYDEEAEALMSAIAAVPRPVIAMIHGFAIGSGLLVAMACDLRIASDAVRVGIPVARIGLVPPVPDVARLVRLVGPGRAKDLLMTGRSIAAGEALSLGLLNRIVPAEELETGPRRDCGAAGPQRAAIAQVAVKQIRRPVRRRGKSRWPKERRGTKRVSIPATISGEGVDAFMEKAPARVFAVDRPDAP